MCLFYNVILIVFFRLKKTSLLLLVLLISRKPQARLNMDGVERSIVTGTGNFVITWNLGTNRMLDQYQIKRYEQNVVADQFQYAQDRSVIVAMADDVRVAYRYQKGQTPRKTVKKRIYQ